MTKPPRVIRTIHALRRELEGAGSVGLVPTMGSLHEGHLSLIRAARHANDTVVVSVFVNPTQFNDPGDLDAYPRDEAADVRLAASAGADLVFAPSVDEVYPEGFATTVSVRGPIAESLEGAHRPGHFDGVATVVTKLFTIVSPTRAYFGEKDAQQLRIVERLVEDLALPIDVVPCPTSREADGLARSSRNVRLSAETRRQAAAIPRALDRMRQVVAAGGSLAAARTAAEGIVVDAGLEVEYIATVDPKTFEPLETAQLPILCAVAARAGDVRLIDNLRCE